MKTRNTRTKLIALAITLVTLTSIWAAWGEDRAHAVRAVQIPSEGFGVARGQTARLNLLNIGEQGAAVEWAFLDSEGNRLAESEGAVFLPAVQVKSFDLDGALLDRARDLFGRAQVRGYRSKSEEAD